MNWLVRQIGHPDLVFATSDEAKNYVRDVVPQQLDPKGPTRLVGEIRGTDRPVSAKLTVVNGTWGVIRVN